MKEDLIHLTATPAWWRSLADDFNAHIAHGDAEHRAWLRRETDAWFAANLPDIREPYEELIFAVGRKFPDETRHQTALRYIREAEERAESPGQAEATSPNKETA